jgi:hypothetical protein
MGKLFLSICVKIGWGVIKKDFAIGWSFNTALQKA